jgi:hypothetical protein
MPLALIVKLSLVPSKVIGSPDALDVCAISRAVLSVPV